MATGHASEVVRQLRRAMLLRDGAAPTDGQLLGWFLEHRDEAAFAALLKRHGPMVWGVCRRVLRHQADAEDAFQVTFLVLVRKAASVRPRELVANWLYGVARQTALKARALAARRRGRERQVMGTPEPAAAEPDRLRDLLPILDEELGRLPDQYRAAVVLCDLEGKTRTEAARQLGLPEGTVASRLARGRALLAKRLARRGLPVSGGALAGALAREAEAGVPAAVMASTIQAAGRAVATGVIPARVAALTEGVIRTMLLTKLRTIAVLAGTLGAFALGLGLSAYDGFAQSVNEAKRVALPTTTQEPPARPAETKSDPRYCRLVFGPNAKVRTLVRLDEGTISIDRDGDGKFDSDGERFASEEDCKDVVIADPDGKTSYVITNVHVLHVVPPEKFLFLRIHVRGALDYRQECIVQMTEDRAAPPQVHFHGPLTVAPRTWTIMNRASRLLANELVDLGSLLPEPVKRLAGKGFFIESTVPKSLRRGGEPTTLLAIIVTEGERGLVAVGSPDEVDGTTSPFPKGVRPVVDVEFPAKKPGDPPVKKRYPLEHLRGGIFRGPVPVPDEAGAGNARVTFSLDAWAGATVAPTTVEIPVEEPREGKDR